MGSRVKGSEGLATMETIARRAPHAFVPSGFSTHSLYHMHWCSSPHSHVLPSLTLYASTHATHARTHAPTHARTHARTHPRMQTHTHARMHARMHSCTHAHTTQAHVENMYNYEIVWVLFS